MRYLVIVHARLVGDDAFGTLAAALPSQASVLLREEAVHLVHERALREALGATPLLVLAPDLRARGRHEPLPDGVVSVEHAGFVDACATHDRVVNWT